MDFSLEVPMVRRLRETKKQIELELTRQRLKAMQLAIIIRAKNGDANYFKRTLIKEWYTVTTEDDNSVLYVSVENNHLHCTKVIYERCQVLLDHQSRMSKASSLHLAALLETKPTLTKFLISVAREKHFGMRNRSDHTPLQLAFIKGHIEAVKLMIEAYPSQLLVNLPRGHILMDALRLSYGKTEDHISVKIRRLVLEKEPNACKIRTGDLNWTPLHDAALEGDLCVIEDIIRFCPDSVHMLDKNGHDFLDIASASGHSEIVIKILQREDLHLANNVSERGKELCIPHKYLVLYRELVKQFGEILGPTKSLDDTISMYATLGRFLGHVSEMVHVKTGNVSHEMISKWEKMATEYSALGLQVSWFKELVAQYSDWFATREEQVGPFKDDIVSIEAKIATKKEALKILENELKELSTKVAKLKKICDTYTPESEDPLLVIRQIGGLETAPKH